MLVFLSLHAKVHGILWNLKNQFDISAYLSLPVHAHNYLSIFFFSNATTYPLWTSWSWTWQECNRLLRLGRSWGAVTLSQWCVSDDRGGCSARRGLKPKFYQSTQTMVTAGIFPFKENSHGRTGNRTRDLIISSQRLWPLDQEAGLIYQYFDNNSIQFLIY